MADSRKKLRRHSSSDKELSERQILEIIEEQPEEVRQRIIGVITQEEYSGPILPPI